jgi:uncharacterized protein
VEENMEQVNRILNNSLYLSCIKKIEELEQDRIYCKHNMEHFMDVARIAYIINLENNLLIDKKLIYATALLHDVGRHEQYLYQTPHEEAGSRISKKILEQCDFLEEEIEIIADAILSHRDRKVTEYMNLNGIIYKADKLSRPCFTCKANETCNWEITKKNMQIYL